MKSMILALFSGLILEFLMFAPIILFMLFVASLEISMLLKVIIVSIFSSAYMQFIVYYILTH